MKRLSVLLSIFGLVMSLGCGEPLAADDKEPTRDGSKTADGQPLKKVVKSDAEWQKLLTRDQFWVTRQKGTEPAFSGKYARYKGKGTFACICCGTELFDARHKFESGTGWPSFYRPVSDMNVTTEEDYSMPQEVRVEVNCASCGAHLGHVFGDGPRPTGLRYCINSVSLKLVNPPAATPKAKASAKPKSEIPKSVNTTDKK